MNTDENADESLAQRRTSSRGQAIDLALSPATRRRRLAGAAEATRALVARLFLIVARAACGTPAGYALLPTRERSARTRGGEGDAQPRHLGRERTMIAFLLTGDAADWTAIDNDRHDDRLVEPTTSRQASRDRRLHEMLGEPLGRQNFAQPGPLEMAGLLEAGLTVRQINLLAFTRWTIGGPRFSHTIRLSWEGERTGLLARLRRQ